MSQGGNFATARRLITECRPILQMPFVYDIPDSAFVDGQGEYDVSAVLSSDGYERLNLL